jgi:hypothetical protein
MIRGEKNSKEERETKAEMSREQKAFGAAREKTTTTTTSENNMRPHQTKPKKNDCRSD